MFSLANQCVGEARIWHACMMIWGFILEHVWHILGFKSASTWIPELEWGLQDGHWGRQVAAGGPPKVKECGHFVVGMVVDGKLPLG